jgi:hypothetical protein
LPIKNGTIVEYAHGMPSKGKRLCIARWLPLPVKGGKGLLLQTFLGPLLAEPPKHLSGNLLPTYGRYLLPQLHSLLLFNCLSAAHTDAASVPSMSPGDRAHEPAGATLPADFGRSPGCW